MRAAIRIPVPMLRISDNVLTSINSPKNIAIIWLLTAPFDRRKVISSFLFLTVICEARMVRKIVATIAGVNNTVELKVLVYSLAIV